MGKTGTRTESTAYNRGMDPLPRKLNKREANITPRVIRWFEKHYPKSCVVEVKIKGNTPAAHQEVTLHKTSRGLFSFKMPDWGGRNPADFFMVKGGDGVLATCEKTGRKWVCSCEVYGSNKEPFSIEV